MRSFVYLGGDGNYYRDDGAVTLRASKHLDRKGRDDQSPEQDRYNEKCSLCGKARHTEWAHEDAVYG